METIGHMLSGLDKQGHKLLKLALVHLEWPSTLARARVANMSQTKLIASIDEPLPLLNSMH